MSYLDSIIDEPLESSEGTNHDDPGSQSSPQSTESQFIDSLAQTSAGSLVEIGDQGVSGVGHDGTEHTSNVASSEGHHQLLRLAALGSGLGHHVLVQKLHSPLEAGELHHGVGDLSAPQRHQGLVESIDSLLLEDPGEGGSQGGGEGANRRGLDSDLARLHGREGDVSKELRAGRGSQVERGPVQIGVLLSDHARVEVLEELIETKLADSLSSVAKSCWSPAKEESPGASISNCHLEPIAKRLVLLLVYLAEKVRK